MVYTALTNDAIDAAVEAVHDAVQDLLGWPILEKTFDLTALSAANARLREVLPQEAAKADQFNEDELADTSDYEKVFDNLSLVAMYVMMDTAQVVEAKSYSAFSYLLTRLVDDVSDLTSWTSNFDIDHNVFVHPDDEA